MKTSTSVNVVNAVALFLILSSYYAVLELQRMKVDPRNFIATYEKDVEADLDDLFSFLRHVHVLEKDILLPSYGSQAYDINKIQLDSQDIVRLHRDDDQLCPWLWRVKEADSRILTTGKFYTALMHLPPLGETRLYLKVTDYSPPKYLALESKDDFIRQRIGIRLRRSKNRIVLQTSVFCNKSKALFQYTFGNILLYITKKTLEESIQNVLNMYTQVSSLAIFYMMANVMFFIYIRLPIAAQLAISENEEWKPVENTNHDRVIDIGQAAHTALSNKTFRTHKGQTRLLLLTLIDILISLGAVVPISHST